MASIFKRFLDRWKVIAPKIAEFQTKVILSLLYFLVVGPTALIAYLFRSDLLKKRHRKAASFWVKSEKSVNTVEGCQRQF